MDKKIASSSSFPFFTSYLSTSYGQMSNCQDSLRQSFLLTSVFIHARPPPPHFPFFVSSRVAAASCLYVRVHICMSVRRLVRLCVLRSSFFVDSSNNQAFHCPISIRAAFHSGRQTASYLPKEKAA